MWRVTEEGREAVAILGRTCRVNASFLGTLRHAVPYLMLIPPSSSSDLIFSSPQLQNLVIIPLLTVTTASHQDFCSPLSPHY